MITRAVTALVVALLLTGCAVNQHPQAGHEFATAIPIGKLTGEAVGQMMLSEIQDNERTLGRALASARIIKIQRLHAGETYPLTHLDGSDPHWGAIGGAGWMVEAVGTFVEVDEQTQQIASIGMHGFRRWGDEGAETFAFFRCWSRVPLPPEAMEGTCTP